MVKLILRSQGKRILTVVLTGAFVIFVIHIFIEALFTVHLPLITSLVEYPSRRCNKCNQHNFTFVDTAETKCGESDVFLLILVISHPNQTTARTSIRDTWASVKSHNLQNIKTVFVVGKTGMKPIDDNVIEESRIHNDIVLADVQESYFKLTEKVLAALTWSVQNCKQFKYILKTDYDSFNNPRLLVDFIVSLGYPKELVSGNCEFHPTNRDGKWTVTKEEYAGYYLPFFCKGPAYMLSHNTAKGFLQLSSNVAYFKLEDVFLTGFVREEYGVEPVQLPHMFSSPLFVHACYAHQVTSMHRAQPENMISMWNWVTSPANRPHYCTLLYDQVNVTLPTVIFLCVLILYAIGTTVRKFYT